MSDINDAVPAYDDLADMNAAATKIARWVQAQTTAVIGRANHIIAQVEPDQIKRYTVSAAYAAQWTQGA